jgi:class 3 adenylate cyclase
MPRIEFSPEPSKAEHAIVVSFDLSGFSDFCSRPDAYLVLPKFLSRLFDELNGFLMEGWESALEQLDELFGATEERRKVVNPEYIKFTGDGALMIWLTGWDGKFSEPFRTALVMAMRNLQARIAAAIPEWEKEWDVVGLPKRARFGIAAGPVYALRSPGGSVGCFPVLETEDYVGYCINLAVRLQDHCKEHHCNEDHCKEVGFLVHETVNPSKSGLVRLEAIGMKGTRDEPVLAFATDLQGLSEGYFKTKFRRI